MLKNGILHPYIMSLKARVRHTNLQVIANRNFLYRLMIKTLYISLVEKIPIVLQVFDALKTHFMVWQIFMAIEFKTKNTPDVQQQFVDSSNDIPISFKPYDKFKQYVSQVIGLIRTGDTSQYDDIILVST